MPRTIVRKFKYSGLNRSKFRQLDNVIVKKSIMNGENIGKGVFSKKKIFKGQIITRFPVDIVFHDDSEDIMYASPEARIYAKKQKISLESYMDKMHVYWYCFSPMDGYTAVPVIKSLRKTDMDWVGHLVNDASNGGGGEKSYDNANRNASLTWDTYDPYVYALKDIEPNEEIYVEYGYNYWKSKHKNS